MERLDRLGWAAGFAFASHGVRAGIRVNDAAVLPRISPLLPPRSRSLASPVVDDLYSVIVGSNADSRLRRFNLVYVGARQLARTMNLADALTTLQEHVHLLVAIRAPRRLFVRGTVLSWRDRAIVIAGDGESAMTSIVAVFLAAGATVYADRYAVLDERGRVHPYRAPTLDGMSNEGALVNAPTCPEAPLSIGVIVCSGREGETPAPVHALTPAQAIVELLRHAVGASLRPQFALNVLRRAVSGARALRFRGDDDGAMREVVHELDSAGRGPFPGRQDHVSAFRGDA